MDFLPNAWGEYFFKSFIQRKQSLNIHKMHDVGLYPVCKRRISRTPAVLCYVDPTSQVQINPLFFRRCVRSLSYRLKVKHSELAIWSGCSKGKNVQCMRECLWMCCVLRKITALVGFRM